MLTKLNIRRLETHRVNGKISFSSKYSFESRTRSNKQKKELRMIILDENSRVNF